MCLATDIPKRSGIKKKQKNKKTIYGYHCTDFWRTFDELWLLNEHRIICFLSHISLHYQEQPQKIWKNLMSSVIPRESP